MSRSKFLQSQFLFYGNDVLVYSLYIVQITVWVRMKNEEYKEYNR